MNVYITREDVLESIKSTLEDIKKEAESARLSMKKDTNIANRSFFQGLALGLETAKLRMDKTVLMLEA